MEMHIDFVCALYILRFMARKTTPIDDLIDQQLQKMAVLENELEMLQIELVGLQKARAAIAGEPLTELPSDSKTIVQFGPEERRRGRSLSDGWKRVLAAIAVVGDKGASLDEIFSFCGAEGIQLQRPTLRAQMSTYVKRGYVGRTGEGKFFIALHGLNILRESQIAYAKLPADSRKGSGGAGPF
jgi:hypothetical protein